MAKELRYRKDQKKPKKEKTQSTESSQVSGRDSSPNPMPAPAEAAGQRFDWNERVTKIRARSWKDTRDLWPNEAPLPGNAGKPPASRVEEIPPLHTLVNTVSDFTVELHDPIAGVRQGCVAEGVFLLHKAANILGAAEINVENGFLTSSIASGYQSAFFSMKAILSFLGITWLQSGRDSYIVDLWPPEGSKQNPFPFSILKVQRIEHRELWTVFLRMLRSTTESTEVWPASCVRQLTALEPADFAKERNELQYRNNHWTIVEDLHFQLIGSMFCKRPTGFVDGRAIKEQESDFSVILAIVLTRMACNMVRDLSQFGGWFQQEWLLLDQWLKVQCHTLFQLGFPDNN